MKIPTPNKYHSFWKWFTKNSSAYFEFERNQDVLFDELAKRLKKISPYACFEFSPVTNGVREFIISADGIMSAAHAVQQLVASAPVLDGWKITAFRPRRDIERVELEGVVLQVSDIRYNYTFNEHNSIDMSLYIKGYEEELSEEYLAGIFVLLDALVGEYDIMTKIGSITWARLSPETHTELCPLDTLPALLDTRRSNDIAATR